MNKTTNTKGCSAGQAWRRLNRIRIRVVFENQENIEKTCYPKGFSKFIFVVSNVWYHVWDRGEMIWLTRSCDFVIDNYILGKSYCDQKGVIIIMTAAPLILS